MYQRISTHGKLRTLIHTWKGFATRNVVYVKVILEGIHLRRNIRAIRNTYTVLKLVQFFGLCQEVRNVITFLLQKVIITLYRHSAYVRGNCGAYVRRRGYILSLSDDGYVRRKLTL